MKKFHITTFGCQMNEHDSEKMAGALMSEGYSPADNHEEADLIIFNTCSIRQKAEQKFFSELGRVKSLKKKNPSLRIAVTGCIAQQMGEGVFKRSPHVDFVIGPQNLHRVTDMALEGKGGTVALEENPGLSELDLPVERREKGRAWVNIMYGCDNFCTYCIVPYTRGREKSRPSESIIREMKELASEGYKEVTLLGQNVNSYRSDIDFPGLLRKINGVRGIERIRFVTSHPRDLSDALIDAVAELDKVCEHLHLPLQSGSTRVLSLMNRGYSYDDYKRKVDALREKAPGIALTTDIIAGFPTEAGADHEATLKALGEIEFDGIFAFKYSPRPGTAAASMDGQLPEEVGLERLKEILALQDDITLAKNKALEGSVQEVLVEGPSGTISAGGRASLTGRTRTNKIVNIECPDAAGNPEDLVGRLVTVKIVKAMRHSLLGGGYVPPSIKIER